MSNHKTTPLFFTLIITFVWFGLMGAQIKDVPKAPATSPCYSARPLLGLELSKSAECFQAVVDAGNTPHDPKNSNAFRTNTYMDFAFIFLYWCVFVLFASELANPRSKWIVASISISAVFDVLENWRILSCLDELDTVQSVHRMLPFAFSAAKWVFLGLALVSAGASVWLVNRRGHKFFSVALILSGLFVPASTFCQQVAPFGYAALAGIAVTIVFLFAWSRPYTGLA